MKTASMAGILLLLFMLSNAALAQVDLNRGLVAYYPFKGNANDASGNNNNPVFNNTTLTNDRFGNKNSACYFNGKTSYIRVKNQASFSPGEISLMAIVKPMGFYNGPCYNNSIIDKGSWDYRSGGYALRFTAGEYTQGNCNLPETSHQNFVGMSYDNLGVTSGDIYVQLNNWYCVVYTFSNKQSKLYINGKLISVVRSKRLIGKNDEDIFIGRKDNEQYPYWFHGVMDEVRIYNRALSAEEVSSLCTDEKMTGSPCILNRPSAKFDYTISDCNKISFRLTSTKQGDIKLIKWSFGDGQNSGQLSPVHIFSKFGNYQAKAIVTNQQGCSDTITKELKITALKTDFVFSEKGGPGQIEFKAKNNNAWYSWDFGNGRIVQNETVTSVTFSKTGTYPVSMFARNNTGCHDTVAKKISIQLPVKIEEIATPVLPLQAISNESLPLPEKREKDIQQIIMVDNDSIIISLYDNGIVDGDSITLIFNDKLIASHILLSSKPVRLTVKIDLQRNSNELQMFADNLGSIPPNTALMIIDDGNNRHTVNITSNKNKNGVVSFVLNKRGVTSWQ